MRTGAGGSGRPGSAVAATYGNGGRRVVGRGSSPGGRRPPRGGLGVSRWGARFGDFIGPPPPPARPPLPASRGPAVDTGPAGPRRGDRVRAGSWASPSR